MNTLKECFDHMIETVLPDGCGERELFERQATFYAGAASAFNMMKQASDLEEKPAVEFMKARMDEIANFYAKAAINALRERTASKSK